ncbi:YARHG domain-containing protein [Clostridium sp. E02]|uniref:YARHG domain-containing protein n=1 Tax=Clostridium sp. E02 TaxID=2487134 RepID=UPI000F51B6C5|nr:YARHG domain-containing protein [Clostridium sp. E02]
MIKKYVFFIMFIAVLMTGCQGIPLTEESLIKESETIESLVPIKTERNNIETVNSNKENYESYTGVWTEGGVSSAEILANGGTEFGVTIKNGNELEGSIFSQQWATQRLAEIEHIKCDIANGTCTYCFSDDGWGGTGTLFITFSENKIIVTVKDYKLDDKNPIGFGISGNYVFERKNPEKETKTEIKEPDFSDRYYSMSSDEMNSEINKRAKYRADCPFFHEVTNYFENVRGVRDVANVIEPLYYTDIKYYSEDDFKDDPLLIIHLAKNEIYAMHGYIFKDEDLNNYFRVQLWYEPYVTPENFDVNVFNEYEKANLKILSKLDTYKQ